MIGIGIGVGFGRQLTLEQRIRALFSNRDGSWSSASDISTLNQVSTGTTPVTAVTQPVGLWLDKRFGLALGPRLETNGGFDTDTGWTKGTGWTISGGAANCSSAPAFSALTQSLSATANKSYKITLSVTRTAGSLFVQVAADASSTIATISASGTYTMQGVMPAGGNPRIAILNDAAGTFAGSIDNISVKLLDGNHLLQSTAAARPTWNVDAGGHYYIDLAGTDDSLSSATGGGGSAGFFYCAAIEPTGGAGTVRTLWSDRSGNSGYLIRLDANNKLSFSAGNGTVFTTLASTATLTAKSLITVKDDGTNLSVQIGSAAEETVARPVVVAGTTGFTTGKDNSAASGYFIGHLYEPIYWKDTAGTAAERANVQALVMSKAGL